MEGALKKQHRTTFRSRLFNLSFLLVSTLLSLLLAEFVLRQIAPHAIYKSLVPLERTVVPNEYYPFYSGIDSLCYQSVNAWGYRSASQFNTDRYGILAIGGSTTYCAGLSDQEAWPWLLEIHLNQNAKTPFTVGNVGVPAFDSYQNLLQLEFITPQFENIKMAIMLMGNNDFLRTLYQGNDYIPMGEKPLILNRTFVRLPGNAGRNPIERTELGMHLRDVKNHFKTRLKTDISVKEHHERVRLYMASEPTEAVPDLDIGLRAYKANLRRIAQIARTQNITLVWLTQPTLWHKGMSKAEKRSVTFATPIKNGKSYANGRVAAGMLSFNQRLIDIAEEEGVILIDLVAKLPKDQSMLFDNCHYTKAGARQVAKIIYNELEGFLTTLNELDTPLSE